MRIMVGKGYAVEIRENCKEYDIAFVYGGALVCNMSTKIGTKSAQYWFNHYCSIMKRIMYLFNQIDMTDHNILCYSKNLAMTKPKDGFEDKFQEENDKRNMLTEWVNEYIDKIGGDKADTLRHEFREYFG